MKFRIIFCCLILISGPGFAQRKLIKKLLSNEPDSTRSASFLPLPAMGYAQEKGWEFGLSGIYSFYADKKDTLTRNSTIMGLASITTKKQSNFYIKSDVWTKQNRHHYLSEIRYKNFPFNFYGIGDETRKADEDKITQKLFRLSGEVEKRLMNHYYGGINFNFESYRFEDREAGGIYTTSPLLMDRDGGKVLFMGLSQIFDTRNTNTFTTQGAYLKLNYAYAPDFFGGDNFTGSSFKLDFRAFKPLDSRGVFAFQTYYQTVQGKQTPFYLLPQLGSDQVMRGYYAGRYLDENLLAAQAELRYRIIPRIAFVAFGGAGNAYRNGNFRFSDLKPSYGGGMRYFFDVERGQSVRFDYGIGEKRPGEKRQTGFYISFGESF